MPVVGVSRQFLAWVLTNAAGDLFKKYIQRPVQAVLVSAIVSSGAGESFDAERQGT